MNPFWMNFSSLIISLAYIFHLSHCIKLETYHIKKLSFVNPKNKCLNDFKNIFIYRKLSRDLTSNISDDLTLKTDFLTSESQNNEDFNPNSKKILLFDYNKRGEVSLKLPIKLVLASLLPDIYAVFEARNKLGLKPLPSLLCCSGGVDSTSLLHSFGLIKQNYKALIDQIWDDLVIKSERIGFKVDDPTSLKVDKDSRIGELMRFFTQFYENFHVVYFNHKQRPDVQKDIEVVERACKEYNFNFIVKEFPSDSEPNTKNDSFGPQCAFRKWRRDTSIRIIDDLSGQNLGSTVSSQDESVLKFLSDNLTDLKSVNNLQDLRDLKGSIFMAHHLDDNLETLLFKVIRGCFISNLGLMELYDKLDHKNYLLVRPFISIRKSKLQSFLQDLNGNYNEDSSNNELKYTRNKIRNLVIPSILSKPNCDLDERDFAGLDQRFKNLSRQCSSIDEYIAKEVDMFFHYINSKYNPELITETDDEKESYVHFYEHLFEKTYGDNMNTFESTFTSSLKYLKRIGLKFPNLFYLREWSVIPTQMVKEQVLNRYIVEHYGKNLLYKTLSNLYDYLNKNLFSPSVRLFSVGTHFICHQGYVLNFIYEGNKANKRPLPITKKDPELVYSDCNMSLYNHIDGLKVSVNEDVKDKFYLNVEIKSKGSVSGKQNKMELDVRYLKDDDVAVSVGLWKNKALKILAKAGIHKVLKDQIPVIAISGTNHVIGLYGINFRAPYLNRDFQNVEYESTGIKQPFKFTLSIR